MTKQNYRGIQSYGLIKSKPAEIKDSCGAYPGILGLKSSGLNEECTMAGFLFSFFNQRQCAESQSEDSPVFPDSQFLLGGRIGQFKQYQCILRIAE